MCETIFFAKKLMEGFGIFRFNAWDKNIIFYFRKFAGSWNEFRRTIKTKKNLIRGFSKN